MIYRKLLIIPALWLVTGCHPAYLYNDGSATGTSYTAASPWYWDNSCNCWVNQTYQAPSVAAPPPLNTTGPCSNCVPTQLPPPPYCPPGSPCQTTPANTLPLIQTNAVATAPAPAPVATAATPQYWDPSCQCWASARYVDSSPVAAPAPAPADTTALIIARNAQRTADEALQASRANTERLNRAYRRSLEK